MDRRPIQARIDATERETHAGPGPDAAALKEAFASWASGVAVVATRDEGRAAATTVTAFAPISPDPALVMVSLGASAVVLPSLKKGRRAGISVLAASQKRLATIFADTLPVGAPAFTDGDAPLLPGALVGLACTVQTTMPAGDHTLVLARVDAVHHGGDAGALVYFRRAYRTLED